MVLAFTVKTGIILFILVALVIILSYILRKKMVDDDIAPEVTNTQKLDIDELKRLDMKDTMSNIKENTSFVPDPNDEVKSDEYNATRKEDDDIEVI